MSTVITDLEPKSVWKHFSELNRIPRPSSHEQNAAKYIVDFANKNGFKVETDAVGNVIIDVPASEDKKDAPTVILQGHMDMVPVAAEGYEFDFLKDQIESYVDGDFVKAKNTTLGADNGIAIAMALSLFEDKTLSHGPLRAIFTVEEETTMKGAANLDAKFLDATYLINLDSEENGFLYV
ncbi:MAG: M20/M25/M40 family metallo-hydrolase, partial [Succinivibrio dextrinosolvens]|nr:M20/M25/M40 family metallo-hydrolase [Succinivibrio dextrinosolvens]